MRTRFVLLILFQVALLVGIIGYRTYWLASSERIILKTTPVDPRDIFRGDYVRLAYDITTLNLDQLRVTEQFHRMDRVYVGLGQDPDGAWRATGVGRSAPAGRKFIQGRALYEPMTVSRWEVTLRDDSGQLHELRPTWFGHKVGDRLFFCLDRRGRVMHFNTVDSKNDCWNKEWQKLVGTVAAVKEEKVRQLQVEYGIESYFVEEGKGRAIETARNARDLRVEVALRRDGKGLIAALLMDGKRLE